MAIYHAHGQIISRSDGRSAVAAAAYRSGDVLFDERLSKQFDYTRKSAVDESLILLPVGAPEWLRDRGLLWNAVEAAERRRNSQTSREFEFALPIELVRKDPEAAKTLFKDFVQDVFVSQGMIADINFHDLKSHNPHSHVMLTMRFLHPSASEFEVGSRHVFGDKAREFNDRGYMDFWREAWADYANAAMAAHGIDARIDHRSLVDQGITDREPSIHVGPDAWAMGERDIATGRWEANAAVAVGRFEKHQEAFASLDAEEGEERRTSGDHAEKEATGREQVQQDMGRIAVANGQLEELGQRLDAALETAMIRASGAMARASTALDGAAQTSLLAKRDALDAADLSGRLAISHGKELAKAAETVLDLTVRMDGAITRSLGWKKSESWLGGGFLIQEEEAVPDQAPAVQKWEVEHSAEEAIYSADEEFSLPAASLEDLSRRIDPAAPHLEPLRRQLEGLALRLDASLAPVLRAQERFASVEERLKAQLPLIVGKVTDAETLLNSLSERMNTAAPRLDGDYIALNGLASRLQAIGPDLVRRAQRRFATVEERLEAYRPGMLGKAMATAMRGLISLGETAQSSWSALKVSGKFDGMERSRAPSPEEVPAKTPEPAPSEVEAETSAYAKAMAQKLLFFLQPRSPCPVRRLKGRYVLDPELISSSFYKEQAEKYGDHQLIRGLLDEVQKGHTNALLRLLAGQVPVVRCAQNGFDFVENEETLHLTPLANELINDRGQFEGLARLAIDRWARGEGEKTAPVAEASCSDRSEERTRIQARVQEGGMNENEAADLTRLFTEGKITGQGNDGGR